MATIARRQENSYRETSFGRARLPQRTLMRSQSRKNAGMTQLAAVEMGKFMSFLVTSPWPMDPHSCHIPKGQEAPHQILSPHATPSRVLSSLTQLESLQGMTHHRVGDVLHMNDGALAINCHWPLPGPTTFRKVEGYRTATQQTRLHLPTMGRIIGTLRREDTMNNFYEAISLFNPAREAATGKMTTILLFLLGFPVKESNLT
jgi:hypothetical protein